MDFEWDYGNRGKNLRHGIQDWEIEEAFEDPRRKVVGTLRIDGEMRRILLGRAFTSGKYLRIVYTVRSGGGRFYIRPISAIEMPPSARARYQR